MFLIATYMIQVFVFQIQGKSRVAQRIFGLACLLILWFSLCRSFLFLFLFLRGAVTQGIGTHNCRRLKRLSQDAIRLGRWTLSSSYGFSSAGIRYLHAKRCKRDFNRSPSPCNNLPRPLTKESCCKAMLLLVQRKVT